MPELESEVPLPDVDGDGDEEEEGVGDHRPQADIHPADVPAEEGDDADQDHPEAHEAGGGQGGPVVH